MINWKLLMLLEVFSFSVFAQLRNVGSEEIKHVQELKRKYPDSGVCSIGSKTSFSFALNKDKNGDFVSVLECVNHKLLAIKDNFTYSDAVFYNNQSEIKSLKAIPLRGSPVLLNPAYKDHQVNGIFYSDAKVCEYGVYFNTRGEKANLEYKKTYYNSKYLTSVYFQDNFPIKEKTIIFEVPDWLEVSFKEYNFRGYEITKSIDFNPKKKLTTYTFNVKNINAFKVEPHAPKFAQNYPHILILVKKYIAEDDSEVNLFNSVSDLYKWYKGLCESVENNSESLTPFVNNLIKDGQTDIEKVEAIYYWIQDNIRYIAFENGIMGFKPEPAKSVFEKKYGDCKGMANLMKEMLKIAGFDSRLTWVGTRGIPYDYSTPSLVVNNHMICTLFLDGKKYFLDGTENFISFNDNAHRIQGRLVLIENGSNYILDTIPEYSYLRNKIEHKTEYTLEGKKLKGKERKIYQGEEKTNILYLYSGAPSQEKEGLLKTLLSSGNKNIFISTLETSSLKERRKPLEVSYDFLLENNILEVNNECYINIDKDKEFSSLYFDSTRVYDYEFYHKVYLVSNIEFNIPDDYKISYIPSSINKVSKNFSFDLKYTHEKNKITYTKIIIINNGIIPQKDFPLWNEWMKEVNKLYNDQIILVKKN